MAGRQIPGNDLDPCVERGGIGELVKVSPSVQEGELQNVLRIRAVSYNRADEGKDLLVVQVVQFGKTCAVPVPALGGANQCNDVFFFGHRCLTSCSF